MTNQETIKNVYELPTTGGWSKGRYWVTPARVDGYVSGVFINWTNPTQEMRQAVLSAQTKKDLLSIPGAVKSADFFAAEQV